MLLTSLVGVDLAATDFPQKSHQLSETTVGLGNVEDLKKSLALVIIAEEFELAAVVADALQDLLHIRKVANMENGFSKFDMPKVALAVLGFPAGEATLAWLDDSQPWVVDSLIGIDLPPLAGCPASLMRDWVTSMADRYSISSEVSAENLTCVTSAV